ncbi:MAG: filamentous hemagglutinin N-terminal domain-containing protein [Phycisphaeraceae bacterium]
MNTRLTTGRIVRQTCAAALACALALFGAVASAGVRDANVLRGDAQIAHEGNHTYIRAADGTVIEYSRFNIGPDELVRFIQPGADARVLNRIVGGDPSVIEGALEANGIVYLVNPAGVYFMPGATVDVAALYAAAGNISNENFLSGHDLFTDLQGQVINRGQIEAAAVHLIGREVANLGSIKAPDGIVTMLAGDRAFIQVNGRHVHVEVDGSALTDQDRPNNGATAPSTDGQAGVDQAGVIEADGGRVVLGAGDLYSLAVRHAGRTQAAGGDVTVAATEGAIDHAGSIDVSSAQGEAGSITLQGPAVYHRGELRADAGQGQAGSIEVTSQHRTALADGSRISAAGGAGVADGGDVLVHSYDGATTLAPGASVDASGGDAGGTGGFVELSARHQLSLDGKVDITGRDGHGTLLLDPTDLTIGAGGVTVAFLESQVGFVLTQADRDVFVEEAVNFDPSVIFRIDAGRHIRFNASLGGGQSLLAFAGLDDSTGRIIFNVPALSFAGDSRLSAPGGIVLNDNVQLGGGGWRLDGAVDSGAGGPFSLSITGNALFAGDIGANNPLAFLHVGDATSFRNGFVGTIGDQSYGDAAIRNDLTLIAGSTGSPGSITFAGNVVAGTAAPPNIDVQGNLTFHDDAGDLIAPLGSLSVAGVSNVTGEVLTFDDQTYVGGVTLGSGAALTSLNGNIIILPPDPVDPADPGGTPSSPQTPGNDGPTRLNVNLASALGDDGNVNVDVDTIDDDTVSALLLAPAAREALAQLRLEVRPVETGQLADRRVLDDLGPPLDAARLSAARVDRRASLEVVQAYLNLFGFDDDRPTPLDAGAALLRDRLAAAWDAYTEQADDPDAGSMLAYLNEGQQFADEAHDMATLRQLVDAMARMGLTTAEYQTVSGILLEQLRPENMTAEQFAAAIFATPAAETTPAAGADAPEGAAIAG